MAVKKYSCAIDQGTTSTRFMIFGHRGSIAASHRVEHKQLYPGAGWVEHDAMSIWENTCECVRQTLSKSGIKSAEISSIGITNQRETTVIWDRDTGKPLYNAVVWQDMRTADICETLAKKGGKYRFQKITGLPLATYFSGPKIRWLIDNIPAVADAVAKGTAMFGTMDTWLIWNLTGGAHVTDPTNASRTMLMNLKTLDWDDGMLKIFGIPKNMLPAIKPSSDPDSYGSTLINGPFGERIPVMGDLGDQQAALFGQACFAPGDAKNTYGTGCFLLLNTGNKPIMSKNGLITTVGYKIGASPAVYALEGSIAVAGALVQWFRDKLGIITSAPEINDLAAGVKDNGGVYFVPAFSGLFAPYWRSDARGLIIGLTHYTGKEHIARAVLEAVDFQAREIFESMAKDSGIRLTSLKVDGGMTASSLLMQFQSDILNVTVTRPKVAETTALGAAYAAGLACGFWKNTDELKANWIKDAQWEPKMAEEKRENYYKEWKKAVKRTMKWVE
ncbi:MAG: glycerol kinase GlpK [Spirochaetia bacterium]|nr:glycerol kinase GlpK [Spirochaetia bacterium]